MVSNYTNPMYPMRNGIPRGSLPDVQQLSLDSVAAEEVEVQSRRNRASF